MIDTTEVTHHIQKHILSVLLHQEIARFRDMRPPKTDTNLYSYHLKLLQKAGFIEKADLGYRLSTKGLAYVDRVNADALFVRAQPKIITMLIVQNGFGDVLLQKRQKQPYINTWTLPYGKLHIDDATIKNAATREAREKLNLHLTDGLEHAGDCYIRVRSEDDIVSTTLVHIFRTEIETSIEASDSPVWARLRELHTYSTAPAVEQIVARALVAGDHFFEEYDIDW